MQGDLEIRGLIVSIKVVGRLGRAKRADLHIEITVNRGVSLQKNELVRTTFERYSNGRSIERIWGIELRSREK